MMIEVFIANKYLNMVYNNIIISNNHLNTLRSKLFTKFVNTGYYMISPEDIAIVIKNFDVVTTYERYCLYKIYKYYSNDKQYSNIILENLDKYVKYVNEIKDNDVKDFIISSIKEMAIKNEEYYIQYFNSEVINNIFICLNQVQQQKNFLKQLIVILLTLSSNSIEIYN